MKKTTKKAGKKAGKRISIAEKTATACTSKNGLAKEIKEHYNLDLTASHRRQATNKGIREEDHGNKARTLDITKARKALDVDQYDDNRKKRQATIDYINNEMKGLKAGDVIRWKGRNRDTKAGNKNTLAKYFFSNVKSSCTMDCTEWNYFTLTSTAETEEGK